MSYLAKGVFRVVGVLHPGYLGVEYVKHCEDSPRFEVPPMVIFDELWVGIDRIPLDLVAIPDRYPNTLVRVTVQDSTNEVVHVERHISA